MLIAQVTDTHIGFDPGNPREFNRQRLDAILDALINAPQMPDLLLATGDLTDRGDFSSYGLLQSALADLPFPVLPCVGNHDSRAAFLTHFPGYADTNGFVQYVHDMPEFRLIVIDTLEEGRHGGAFCDARAAWLRQRLAEAGETPVYIIMHHPPFDCGIDWMLTDVREPWVARFQTAIADAPQVRGLICGHLHRPVTAAWQGLTVTVCGASAPQVVLDLRPMNPEQPDDRPLITAEAPKYALHYWNGREIVSYFQAAEDSEVLARFTGRMSDLVAHLQGERPQS